MKTDQQITVLTQLARESLTGKQQLILKRSMLTEGMPISEFVTHLRHELTCADSTLWKSIRALRERKLLEESTKLRLTDIGRLLLEQEELK